jgi:hypothetical protein
MSMRFKILVFFVCASAVGTCQSVTPAPKTTVPVDESRQHIQQRTDCKKAPPDSSVSKLAPWRGERRSDVQTRRLDEAPFTFPAATPCPFDQRLWLSFQAKLEPLPTQGPHLKFQPIPTEWPNAKFEAIPTDWPDLKIVPLASQVGTPAPLPAK